MIAIFIVLTAVVAALSLITNSLSASSVYKDRLIAAYLAQEGIEIIRNIRDKNWLEGEDWDKKLEAGDWQADYTTNVLQTGPGGGCDAPGYNCNLYALTPLRISTIGSEFYNYTEGTETRFRRQINLTYIDADTLLVSAYVYWEDKKGSHYFGAQEKILGWR